MPERRPLLPKEAIIAAILANPVKTEPLLNTALFMVSSAFHGVTTWDKGDYIAHCLHVGLTGTQSHYKMTIGILHDLIEDTDWTLDDLRLVGFNERIINGVDSLSKREGEKYFDFVRRCSLNPDGIDIKLNDLDHNMRVSRSPGFPDDWQLLKQQAYIVSYQYLLAVKKEDIEAGSSIAAFMASRPHLNNAKLLTAFSTESPVKLAAAFSPETTPAGP